MATQSSPSRRTDIHASRRVPLGARRQCIGLLLAGLTVTMAMAQPQGAESIDDKAALCGACHGANGVPISKEIPVIWGQHAGYIFLNLRDIKTGARKSEAMAAVVATLSRSDMLALGEYFESKPWPDLGQPRASADVASHAAAVTGSGQCTSCHLDGYLGDSGNPRLAGQSVDYLRKTMRDFHDGHPRQQSLDGGAAEDVLGRRSRCGGDLPGWAVGLCPSA